MFCVWVQMRKMSIFNLTAVYQINIMFCLDQAKKYSVI